MQTIPESIVQHLKDETLKFKQLIASDFKLYETLT